MKVQKVGYRKLKSVLSQHASTVLVAISHSNAANSSKCFLLQNRFSFPCSLESFYLNEDPIGNWQACIETLVRMGMRGARSSRPSRSPSMSSFSAAEQSSIWQGRVERVAPLSTSGLFVVDLDEAANAMLSYEDICTLASVSEHVRTLSVNKKDFLQVEAD